jgi:sterol 3beta-glucosyltransferase
MRITILSSGTRGDVQPYLALGLGLQQAGHTVTLAASDIFERWIRGAGLGFASIRLNPQEVLQSRDVQKSVLGHKNPISFFMHFPEYIRQLLPLFNDMFNDMWKASRNAEFIVAPLTTLVGYDCAVKLNCPGCLASLLPMEPTTEFPSFLLPPGPALGGGYNRLTHKLIEEMTWLGMRTLNQWRKKTLGLPPLSVNLFAHWRSARVPVLHAWSPAVLSKPHDWPDWYHVTGYWFLEPPAGFQPPPALLRFLEAGSPPVYIGFGSMIAEDPHRLTETALAALQLTGQRGILLSGWSGLSSAQIPETVFCLKDVPHTWLFPRMAAIVHHGGAGTTGASLRAGIPTIVTPFLLDQFGWGKVVSNLGVGPKAIPAKKLTAEKLAAAIQTAVTDTAIQAHAAEIGKRIRSEDGIINASEKIMQILIQSVHQVQV